MQSVYKPQLVLVVLVSSFILYFSVFSTEAILNGNAARKTRNTHFQLVLFEGYDMFNGRRKIYYDLRTWQQYKKF